MGDDFKSGAQWPSMAAPLPVYTGGKDRTQGRQMIANLGGQEGFKTAKQTNTDGSVTTCQLKGNMSPQISRTLVNKLRKYIEEAYSLRVYWTQLLEIFTYFMKDTPLLYRMELRTQQAPTGNIKDNEFYYDQGPPFHSVDGMQVASFRKTKKANIHFFDDNTDNDAAFPDSGQTYFSRDHTVTGAPGFERRVIRVSPISTSPMTIRSKNETLFFKKPPDAITTGGITHFDAPVCHGLPWHGVYSPGIITLTNGEVVATAAVDSPFIAPITPTHHTYINFNRPAAPAGTPEELAAGMTWKNDIVWCGQNKVYAGSGQAISPFHSYYSSPDGSLHQMVYVWVPPVSGNATWYFYCYDLVGGFLPVYYISNLPCPIHLVQYPQFGNRVFWKNWFGAQAWEFVKQSPDGSRCLVIPPSYDDIDRPDYMLELRFSGGNAGQPLVVTHRKVDEWFAASSHVQTGNNYSFGIPPGPSPYDHPNGLTWSFSEIQNNPISIGYTKDNELIFEKLERTQSGNGASTPQAPPLLVEHTSNLYDDRAFITYIDGVEVTRHEEHAAQIGGVVQEYRIAYLIDFVWRLYDPPNPPSSWPAASPTYDYIYVDPVTGFDPYEPPIVTPSVNTGPSWNSQSHPGFMSLYYRVGNNLTLKVQKVFDTAIDGNGDQYDTNWRYIVLDAQAYGQQVTGLIGYEYQLISSSPTVDPIYATSFNPRTQEILFSDSQGWA